MPVASIAKLNISLSKLQIALIGMSALALVALLFIFTAGGYTVINVGYLNNLKEESAINYERALLSYNIGLLEGYSEAIYLAVITSYEAWIKTNNPNIALALIEIYDTTNIVEMTRNLIKGLERYASTSKYYGELLDTVIKKGYEVLNAYSRYIESLNKGDLTGAKEAIKDMRYNIDTMKIASGNIVAKT